MSGIPLMKSLTAFKKLFIELTFPDDDGVPPHLSQLGAPLLVALLVACDFLCPEVRVALGHHEVSASLVPMPEASVYEYHRAVLAQYYVGRARQPLHVHPVAESPAMEVSPHRHLWLGVAAMYAGHASVPLLSGQFVGHGGLLKSYLQVYLEVVFPLLFIQPTVEVWFEGSACNLFAWMSRVIFIFAC